MVTPEKELAGRFALFADNDYLAEALYELANAEDTDVDGGVRYTLLEARENMLGLYELCRSYVIHQANREREQTEKKMLVADTELTARTKQCLLNAGITTVSDLLVSSDTTLLHVQSLGRKSLSEINEWKAAFKWEPT